MVTWHKEKILAIIESMVANLQKNKEKINNLNVFPVPDGDTGANMYATLISSWNNIKESSKTDSDILKDFAKGALLGARGNSGVIVSQIIRGFQVGIDKMEDGLQKPEDLKGVLKSAKEYAYSSVSEPVEGTILTIIRKLYEDFDPNKSKSFSDAFVELEKIAREATNDTIEQLQVLKDAGVVDSGAYGLTTMIEGITRAFLGNSLKINVKDEIRKDKANQPKFLKANPNKNIGYCTEFILTLREKDKFNKDEFEKRVSKMGDSIVLIQDGDVLKLHIHVKSPGLILNEGQRHGEFSSIKVDNMTSQVSEKKHDVFENNHAVNLEDDDLDKNNNQKDEDYYQTHLGIVVVSNGLGIDREFNELGVDKIISGGQTMNPSVSSFVSSIEEMKYKNILILPNNSNIILTADVVKRTVDNKNIFILPTKSIPQGLVALYNINKEMVDFENYQDMVISEFQHISEGQITKAIRNSNKDNLKIKKDDYIAILNNQKIINNSKDINKVIEKLINEILKDNDFEILNIFYNDSVDKAIIDKIVKKYSDLHKNIEISSRYGGQQIYNLIVFGE